MIQASKHRINYLLMLLYNVLVKAWKNTSISFNSKCLPAVWATFAPSIFKAPHCHRFGFETAPYP